MTEMAAAGVATKAWFDEIRELYLVSPLHAHFGLALDVVEQGKVVVSMNGKREFLNAHGVMAGSVITGMIDSALLQAVRTQCASGDFLTTLEIKVNFLAPAKGSRFTCEANVIRAGGSTGVSSAVVTAEDGSAVAGGMGTIFIRRKPKG
ncbi:PaaI family thioesterase [Bradyrhizobium sp. LHD-71]|uniref:PaaI family thioesterase n=1 Tax=Bradyrhizobium sp. LHD-71 TaxID=3072141 RepID=UPI00280DC5AF|nr:PaaI family thioesterase [Bradyrhizobium sp. LHD-71]MDQ8728197.1 PaaI family thioesterase [Bradyrhizobium sp. LHD-71]